MSPPSPDGAEAGAHDDTGSQQHTHHDGHDSASESSVGDHRGIGWHGHVNWCPCCHIDEGDCVRHLPLGREIDWADGPIGVVDQGGLRITSLREWRGAA